MAESVFKIKINGLDKLSTAIRRSPQEVHAGLSQALRTSLNLVRPILRAEAPAKTGKLRRNIQSHTQGLVGRVGPSLDITPYAWGVHEGRKAHLIRPRTKKALYWPGAKHPVKLVRHPGNKPNPFVERTYNKTKPVIEEIFGKEIKRFVKEFHR